MNINIENHYWFPIEDIISNIEKFCKEHNFKNILEIGPGTQPFSLANNTIGCNEKINNYTELDIDVSLLPYTDKSIDFVYSRHTLEDIQNPDFVMREILRISNSGYIETPSPLIEITKGVDVHPHSDKFGGYIHHRYIIWSDIEKCEIYFLPKYSCIIDNYIDQNSLDKTLLEQLIKNKIYWNNYFIWENKIPKIIMYKNGVNIGGLNRKFVEDYMNILSQAVNTSILNTDYFIKNYITN
jgi:hypothetical protein